jgi:sulfate transport system permease protein
MKPRRHTVLPGFRLTLGFTVFYLCLIVLIPLLTLPARTATLTWDQIWLIISDPRVVASYKLSVGAALIAAAVNAVFGLLVAWVLARYQFPGKRIVDALIDLPFALPTAVAGITLTTLYAPNGWLGQPLDRWGPLNGALQWTLGVLGNLKPLIDTSWDLTWFWSMQINWKIAYTPNGIVIALIFIGLPFVVRTLQPVIEDLDVEIEEAATSLGASRIYVLTRIILPYLYPAWLTGFALAFARAVGEYGSVVFISGNMPMRTEISPLLIMTKLEQYDYAGATAIAIVMLLISFTLLLTVNALQGWSGRRLSH